MGSGIRRTWFPIAVEPTASSKLLGTTSLCFPLCPICLLLNFDLFLFNKINKVFFPVNINLKLCFLGFLRFAGMNSSQLKGFPTEPVRLKYREQHEEGTENFRNFYLIIEAIKKCNYFESMQ